MTKRSKLDLNKNHKILEHFWKEYSIIEGIANTVYLKFKNHNKNFKKLYYMRDKKLNNILILHNCGLNNYLNYVDYAKKLYEWGVHKPDCKIITDAHDCGKTHSDLIFVSADGKMIEKLIKHTTPDRDRLFRCGCEIFLPIVIFAFLYVTELNSFLIGAIDPVELSIKKRLYYITFVFPFTCLHSLFPPYREDPESFSDSAFLVSPTGAGCS